MHIETFNERIIQWKMFFIFSSGFWSGNCQLFYTITHFVFWMKFDSWIFFFPSHFQFFFFFFLFFDESIIKLFLLHCTSRQCCVLFFSFNSGFFFWCLLPVSISFVLFACNDVDNCLCMHRIQTVRRTGWSNNEPPTNCHKCFRRLTDRKRSNLFRTALSIWFFFSVKCFCVSDAIRIGIFGFDSLSAMLMRTNKKMDDHIIVLLFRHLLQHNAIPWFPFRLAWHRRIYSTNKFLLENSNAHCTEIVYAWDQKRYRRHHLLWHTNRRFHSIIWIF